jgi:hypothetical protein
MDALRHVTLDPAPTLWVIAIGGAILVALRIAAVWSERHGRERTRRALREVEGRDTRT